MDNHPHIASKNEGALIIHLSLQVLGEIRWTLQVNLKHYHLVELFFFLSEGKKVLASFIN